MERHSGAPCLRGLAYSVLWIAVTRDVGLLHDRVDPVASRAALRRFGLGNIAYLATIGLSFVSAIATLSVHAALAIYYCFDQLATSQSRRHVPRGVPGARVDPHDAARLSPCGAEGMIAR
jgi:hypothetical protein